MDCLSNINLQKLSYISSLNDISTIQNNNNIVIHNTNLIMKALFYNNNNEAINEELIIPYWLFREESNINKIVKKSYISSKEHNQLSKSRRDEQVIRNLLLFASIPREKLNLDKKIYCTQTNHD